MGRRERGGQLSEDFWGCLCQGCSYRERPGKMIQTSKSEIQLEYRTHRDTHMHTHTHTHRATPDHFPSRPVSILAPEIGGKEGGGDSPMSACRTFFMRMTLTVSRWHGDSPSCGWRGHGTHSSCSGGRWPWRREQVNLAQAPTAQTPVTSPLGPSAVWRILLVPRGSKALEVRGLVLGPL